MFSKERALREMGSDVFELLAPTLDHEYFQAKDNGDCFVCPACGAGGFGRGIDHRGTCPISAVEEALLVLDRRVV